MITVTTNALHQIKKLITSRENIPAGIKVGINTNSVELSLVGTELGNYDNIYFKPPLSTSYFCFY